MSIQIMGYIGMAACVVWLAVFWKTKPKKGLLAGVLAAFAVFAATAFLPQRTGVSPPGPVQKESSAVSGETAASAPKPFRAELTGGYYTPGIDFPAGTYDITVLNGSGTVYYTNPSGAGKSAALSTGGVSQLKGIPLPLGESLSVSGMKIRLESAAADSGALSDRENPATKTVTLSPGTYKVGVHLEEGVYDVVAVRGKGTVVSDSEGALLREALNASGSDYEKIFRNVTLDSGISLTVTGMTVQLIPSK